MRLFYIASRELRSAARRKATYRARWMSATMCFALLLWLTWLMDGFTNSRNMPRVFDSLAFLALFYCAALAAAHTADSVSAERREGTLGLLYMANLNGLQIILGKFCSTGLASTYGLLAVFPMVALPLLAGGISFAHFGRVVLALLTAMLLGLAAGFRCSVSCRRQSVAIGSALGLTLAMMAVPPLAGAGLHEFRLTEPLADFVAVPSPLYALFASRGTPVYLINGYWYSVSFSVALSIAWILLSARVLSRTWQDAPSSAPWRLRMLPRSWAWVGRRRAAVRRQLLGVNPVFWLASRHPVPQPFLVVLAIFAVVLTEYGTAPFLTIKMGSILYLGDLFAWLWMGLGAHAVTLYYAAMVAAQCIAENKQNGSLELIVCSPLRLRSFSRGLWLAYARRMFFPALFTTLVHVYFLVHAARFAATHASDGMPFVASPGQMLWASLWNLPIGTSQVPWEMVLLFRIILACLGVAFAAWISLGWVGQWLGLRMKHPGFAPLACLALLIVPPVILLSIFLYVAGKYHLSNLPERLTVPGSVWAGLMITLICLVVLVTWAGTAMRYHGRAVAMIRYEPLPRRRWWRPDFRLLLRPAIAGAAMLAIALLGPVAWFRIENRQNRARWTAFETSLRERRESLDLAPLMPAPISPQSNLHLSPALSPLLRNPTNELVADFRQLGWEIAESMLQQVHAPWTAGARSDGKVPGAWTLRATRGEDGTLSRSENARAIIAHLQSRAASLDAIAAAARHYPAFQVTTNTGLEAVLNRGPQYSEALLHRLGWLFALRASALLETGRSHEAAEDTHTALLLVNYSRQMPDAAAVLRSQSMLASVLEVIWEGMLAHAWTSKQLESFQQQLEPLNLFADYTNAVGRIVRAQIAVWRIAETNRQMAAQYRATSTPGTEAPAWLTPPSAWHLRHCMLLYEAGQVVLQNVDAAARCLPRQWVNSDISEVNLVWTTSQLFQQYPGWGSQSVNVTFMQTSLNQALLACAVERFKLRHGQYPETTAELVPEFLNRIPTDPMNGRPMFYEPLPRSGYMLWSVGPNLRNERANKYGDDWQWKYSTNRVPVGVTTRAIKRPGRPAN